MQLEGTHTFRAPRDQVWTVMLDPEQLAGCLPGGQDFRALGNDSYEVTLNVKVGPVTGAFKSRIQLADIEEPNSYRLLVEGSGSPGAVKGAGTLTFGDAPEGTLVSYKGDVQVTGTVARVGQRLLPGVAKMMVGRFFECMDGKVGLAGQATSASGG
jgi:carbon monoxide dehydrogenase subunit G